MARRTEVCLSTLLSILPALLARPALAGTPFDMEAGYEHNCVITDCDTAWCWGGANNTFGEDGDRAGAFVDIAVGVDHTCGLVLDDPSRPLLGGKVECWGRRPRPGEPENWDLTAVPSGNYRQIDGGTFVTCGIRAAPGTAQDGTVACWGWQVGGVTSAVPTNPQGNVVKFRQVSAGHEYACGVTTGRSSVYCWGATPGGLTRLPIADVREYAGETWQKVSAGTSHVCALSDYNDGTGGGAVYCWGTDFAGQVNPEPTGGALTKVVLETGEASVSKITFEDPTDPKAPVLYSYDVSAGGTSTCVVQDDVDLARPRNIRCWGYPFTPARAGLTTWAASGPTTFPPLPAGFAPASVFLAQEQLCAIDELHGDIECWSLAFPTPLGILDHSDPACGRIVCTADDLLRCL